MCKQTFLSIIRTICFSSSVMAGIGHQGNKSAVCHRIGAIEGYQGKQNDVIVCGSTQTAKQHILFFGGDVQDYQENMVKYNKEFKEWNLEASAQLVQSQFTDSAVFIIKPSYMYLNTFSVYKNFLEFDEEGRPTFSPGSDGFSHLQQLYYNIKNKITANNHCDKLDEQSCDLSVPIKLIGFSKGCVVLNQLVYELHSSLRIATLKPFLDQIAALYWLDGGHTGGSKAYITDYDNLRTLADWNKDIFVNVTPYQIKDPNRKWIGQEEKEFVSQLKKMNARITENRHFMREPGSIQRHFEILKNIQ